MHSRHNRPLLGRKIQKGGAHDRKIDPEGGLLFSLGSVHKPSHISLFHAMEEADQRMYAAKNMRKV